MLGSETERNSHFEGLEQVHLPVKPLFGVWATVVRPTQARSKLSHAQALKLCGPILQAVIFEMKPLTDAQRWRVVGEQATRLFGRAVSAQQTHVEVPVIA